MTSSSTTTPTITFGELGMMLSSGQQVLTVTGRTTTPFPKVDVSTQTKTTHTLRRVDAWLLLNARAESASRRLIDTWPADPKELTQADRDLAEMVLFDASR